FTLRRRPRPTRFPYTTLFRSCCQTHNNCWLSCPQKRSSIVARRADPQKVETFYNSVKRHPGKHKGFFARVLDWHRQKVERTLVQDRKSTRLNSSHVKTSYAVF